jgi:DNA-binding response OmpR family regulator
MPRILVVEDEDKLRKALTKGLTEQGYDVTAVEDGREGLERAGGEPLRLSTAPFLGFAPAA